MNSIEFLDAVRERHGLPSDNQLAAFLKVPQGSISLVRTGRRKLDTDLALAIAAALDEAPGYVLAEIQAERAKRPEHRSAWRAVAELAKKAQAGAVVFALVVAGAVAPSSAPADTASDPKISTGIYIIRS